MEHLTKREKQVLEAILQEKTNQEISKDLKISKRTVEVYRKSLLLKAGARNTVGLVKYAFIQGLCPANG